MLPVPALLLLAPLAAAEPKVLLELFTSQGCYSCPPAEDLLAERYLGRDDVLALELHVDYWDDLVYWGSSWEDPWSSPAYSRRQRAYAFRSGVFTPQMVVQGASSASGTSRRRIDAAIADAQAVPVAATVSMRPRAGGGWTAEARGGLDAAGPVEALRVVYLKETETAIAGGENKGKILRNHNVVTVLERAGALAGVLSLELPPPPPGHGCAVILQRAGQGPVLGAWTCPPAAAGD